MKIGEIWEVPVKDTSIKKVTSFILLGRRFKNTRTDSEL